MLFWHQIGTDAPAQSFTVAVLYPRYCVFALRYQEFKAALEGLDPKRQSASPLPIIYQWEAPIAGAGTKCALPVCPSRCHKIAPHHSQVASAGNSRGG